MISYNLPRHKKGDTFDGILFTVTVNGNPVDLTGAIIEMDIRNPDTEVSVLRLTSDIGEGGGITIDANPTLGKFSLDSMIINIPAEVYDYDIQITFTSGIIKTYVGGKWNIEQDVTYE